VRNAATLLGRLIRLGLYTYLLPSFLNVLLTYLLACMLTTLLTASEERTRRECVYVMAIKTPAGPEGLGSRACSKGMYKRV